MFCCTPKALYNHVCVCVCVCVCGGGGGSLLNHHHQFLTLFVSFVQSDQEDEFEAKTQVRFNSLYLNIKTLLVLYTYTLEI